MQVEDHELLMKWRQFVYFQQGISAKDFKKEKISDIIINVEMFDAMGRKQKRIQNIEDMKRAAMQGQ